MFFLTRTIVEFLEPLNLSILLFLLTLILLLARRVRLGIITLVLGLVVMIGCGYGVGVRGLVEEKEYTYQPLSENEVIKAGSKNVRYVVVLGSGHVSDIRLPATSQVGGSSLFRLIEGIRIHNLVPGSILVISGGVGHDPIPNADVVAAVAASIGVSPDSMIVKNSPRDTIQEAEVLLRLIGSEEFFLVTSAMHMQRAMKIFENAGMNPLPSPTDYIMKGASKNAPGHYLPSTGNIDLCKRLMYEWIGSQWMKIKELSKNYL